jgi:hypothetical protein
MLPTHIPEPGNTHERGLLETQGLSREAETKTRARTLVLAVVLNAVT